jgi:hypothetical protein
MRKAISDCKKTLNKKLLESLVYENFNNNWDQIIARVEKIEKTNIIEDFTITTNNNWSEISGHFVKK